MKFLTVKVNCTNNNFVDVIFYLCGTFLPLVIYARLTGLKERNDKSTDLKSSEIQISAPSLNK